MRSSVTMEPLGLVADLLYALGSALWTGVVVVVLVQVFPETERRQFKQALDALPAAAGSCERGDAAWINSSRAAA